ncbi:MAG TPA: PilZ domain-containing protein [Dehalococcoidia bacterium]|nr:PilZ domain-containing protein [Dehalococcoidia bacterium]
MPKPEHPAKPDPAKERRRSPRVELVVPVQLEWTTDTGEYIEVNGETEIVSAHGALIRLKTAEDIASEVRIRNRQTGKVAWSSVVSEYPAKGDQRRVAFVLSTPDGTFWGGGVPPPYSNKE